MLPRVFSSFDFSWLIPRLSMAQAVLRRERSSLGISVLLHTRGQVLAGPGFLSWKISYGFCRDKLSFPVVEGKEGNHPVLQQFLMEIVFLCQTIPETFLKDIYGEKCCNSLAFRALFGSAWGWKMVNLELTAATLFYSSEKHLVLSHLRDTTAPTELELQELGNLRVWLWCWCSNMMGSKFTLWGDLYFYQCWVWDWGGRGIIWREGKTSWTLC